MKKETSRIEKDIEKIAGKFEDIIHLSRHRLTLGQKASDSLTKLVGSWTFIFIVILFLIFWIFLNGYLWFKILEGNPFDPFPFIILNLILSSLAALQAPIILMSQNRATQRDRIRMEYDYKVDKKAEKEIREIKEQINRIERKLR